MLTASFKNQKAKKPYVCMYVCICICVCMCMNMHTHLWCSFQGADCWFAKSKGQIVNDRKLQECAVVPQMRPESLMLALARSCSSTINLLGGWGWFGVRKNHDGI